MSRTSSTSTGGRAEPSSALSVAALHTTRPTFAALPSTVAATSTPASRTATAPVTTAAAPSTSSIARPAAATVPHTTPAPRTASIAPRPQVTSRAVVAPAPRRPAVQRGVALPLHFGTGSATRVITVTARSHGSTVATLQAWTKVAAGGWRKYGTAATAHIGAQGMSSQPSESRSATPIGSFTVTQAFGYYGDPGTALPYFKTRASDWWISQPGRLYNTHQRCSSGCAFRRGSPNEHLRYETPFYNYAVVIDYNTRNAPGGVRQGAGSAFFLHVTDGAPTAGCVAISQPKLVSLMRWLTPSAHPRILIGVV
jgi:L,D-peptidoglycan transpeptidase YkuD (ErfK/YbiS/YcfS/YnhG family)